MPSQDDIHRAYNDGAAGYAKSPVKFFEPIARHLVHLAGIKPGDRVLDLGCGAGAVMLAAAETAGRDGSILAVDASPAMVARASETRAAADRPGWPPVTICEWDASRLPDVVGPVDVITASMLVSLLPDLTAALQNWRGLLAPGGTLAFSWRIAGDPRWRAPQDAIDAYLPPGMGGWDEHATRPPFNDPLKLKQAVIAAGYHKIQIEPREIVMRFPRPRDWWDACWHTGWASTWQHIPEARREQAWADAAAALEPHREPDGSITRIQTIGYLTARAAQ